MLEIVVIPFCLAVSFLLSGMEAGLFALSRLRIRQWMRSGKEEARILHGYLQDPEPFLWTILVGNTLSTFLLVSIVSFDLFSILRHHPFLFLLTWLVLVFLLYSTMDLLPKTLFRRFPNRLCLKMTGPFRFLHLILSPIVFVLSRFARLFSTRRQKQYTGQLFGNREELRLVMLESTKSLSKEERSMINRVLDLQSLTVGHVMVPWDLVAKVDVGTSLNQAVEICRQQNRTRLPVCKHLRSNPKAVGILNLKQLLYSDSVDLSQNVGSFLQPAFFLDWNVRLELAMQRMRKNGQHLAIVLDRNRKESGVISLQDILKVVFGKVDV